MAMHKTDVECDKVLFLICQRLIRKSMKLQKKVDSLEGMHRDLSCFLIIEKKNLNMNHPSSLLWLYNVCFYIFYVHFETVQIICLCFFFKYLLTSFTLLYLISIFIIQIHLIVFFYLVGLELPERNKAQSSSFACPH